jgi:DNA-binding NarL/FixJ family response regulator
VATTPRPRIAILGGTGGLGSEALTWMLTEGGSSVLGCYPDYRALEAALRAERQLPQAALVDADDPVAGPFAVAELRLAYPELKILLLCGEASPVVVHCVLEQHVEGVVLKSDSAEEVILALRHVLEGRAVMPAGWHEKSLELGSVARLLSVREREVLDLAAAGLSNREIAEHLVISTNTVKFHLREIYSILGVHNRVQASQAMNHSHT